MRNEILRVDKIFKTIDTFPVLRGVSFCLEAGKGLCVIADNYDTKKNLIQIICGECRPDAGRIFIDDRLIQLFSGKEAQNEGVFWANQELLISTMSVASNLFLTNDAYYNFYGFTSKMRMQRDAELLLKEYGMQHVNPAEQIRSLALGDIMILSVLKAVSQHAKIIILDDACNRLSENELEKLQQTCEKVKEKGIGILCVTNQLNRKFRIFEEVSIIKNHVTIQTSPMNSESMELFLGLNMHDTELPNTIFSSRKDSNRVIFEVNKLRPAGINDVKEMTFHMYEKEILGICDKEGNTIPLFKAIMNGKTDYIGKLIFRGKQSVFNEKNALFDLKIAFISCDDGKRRVFDQMNIYDNITIMKKDLIYNRLGILNRRYQKYIAKHCLELLHEEGMLQRYSKKRELRRMSIDDQMKLDIARRLCVHPELFVFYKPGDSFRAWSLECFMGILKNIRKLRIPVLVLSNNEEYLQRFCDRIIHL